MLGKLSPLQSSFPAIYKPGPTVTQESRKTQGCPELHRVASSTGLVESWTSIRERRRQGSLSHMPHQSLHVFVIATLLVTKHLNCVRDRQMPQCPCLSNINTATQPCIKCLFLHCNSLLGQSQVRGGEPWPPPKKVPFGGTEPGREPRFDSVSSPAHRQSQPDCP